MKGWVSTSGPDGVAEGSSCGPGVAGLAQDGLIQKRQQRERVIGI